MKLKPRGKPFAKGNSGRPKGAPNKFTSIKEAVLFAFNELQQDDETDIIAFAKEFPRDFHQIAARLIPTEIQANLTGKLEIKRPSWFDATQIEPTIHILPPETKPEAVSN